MHYGCAWYPEQWPADRWATDLAMMREAGMTVVRIAEFAWSRLEPREGGYDLDWLVRAVDAAGRAGLQCAVGTPTATPPAWLTQAYPDTLGVDGQGRRREHGARCHFSVTSPRYRGFCRGIVTQMVSRLGEHPHVIGWQIDNEYHVPTFDASAAQRWREWLRARYGSLDELNRRWTTEYWSQTYTEWTHVPLGTLTYHNPCLNSEFKRFMSDMYREYQREQIDIIRSGARPGQWITHNFHAQDELDSATIAQDLDRASYDIYVGFSRLDPSIGWVSDLTRGISGGAGAAATTHWVMECQPNHVLYGDVPVHLDPGEVRRMVWHFVAHGAEGVLFWQWRAGLGSHEQYWGTVVGNDGRPRPVFGELSQVGRELARVRPLLEGARPPRARVAMLHTYPDRWSLLGQRHHSGYDVREVIKDWYQSVRRLGLDVDVIDPNHRPLDGYALVLAPALYMTPEPLAMKLAAYVRQGGHLVLGPRSGMKDEVNALLPSRQPGAVLGELLGAAVLDYYPIRAPHPVGGPIGEGTAKVWAEPLELLADDAEVLLKFGAAPAGAHGSGWLPEKPAAVRRKVGTGSIAYVGAWLDEQAMSAVAVSAAGMAGLPAQPLPAGLEVTRRPTTDGRQMVVLINHGDGEVAVDAYGDRTNLLTDRPVDAHLAAGEIAVVVE